MKKYRVLQLGLQLGFLVLTNIYNSWYLYNLECHQTSCNSCNGHSMSYTILYIWCNSHVIICIFLWLISMSYSHIHSNMAFHPFVNKWCMLIPFATYLQLFYNEFDEYNLKLFHSSIWRMDFIIIFYNLFTTILQVAQQIYSFIISFIHLSNEFHSYPLQLTYN